ncbi:MAG: helix-turn-helix transcriptional regulator [Clostridia bacterium]|nr:helix-turn-helix transcriptional regulator [Clostridia bacterium]
MDQKKIGQFIAQCRREKVLTQFQLGEMLGITDRAVSKWERGLSLPDASIMQELCDILGISINELFTGERLPLMDDYNKKAEENLLEMKRREEEQNRQMLWMEDVVLMMSISTLVYVTTSLYTQEKTQKPNRISFKEIRENPEVLLPFAGSLAGLWVAGHLERTAGYYKCEHCGYEFVPEPGAFFAAPHFGRTHKMTCPHCGKKSWMKKILVKDD